MKIKNVLISQPKPEDKSPYATICENLKITIDFIPFVYVERCTDKEFRVQKVDISQYSGVILTSKSAVDYFFDMSERTRYKPGDHVKFFCNSHAIANYLQKYMPYRKKRIYGGPKGLEQLRPLLRRHKAEKFLLPCSDKLSPAKVKILEGMEFLDWTKVALYKTAKSDLSNIAIANYDVLVFFSPSGVESLFHNFPDFKQENTHIATFGKSTFQLAENFGLDVAIKAPSEEFPSMKMALESYIKANNKR